MEISFVQVQPELLNPEGISRKMQMSPLMALVSIHSSAWDPFAVCENSFVQAGNAGDGIPGARRKSHDQPGTGNDEFIPGKHKDQAAEPGGFPFRSDGITPAVFMCEIEHKIAELQLRLLVRIIQQYACHGPFPLMLEYQRGQLPEHVVRACNMLRPGRVERLDGKRAVSQRVMLGHGKKSIR
jgi:hypothetical protein